MSYVKIFRFIRILIVLFIFTLKIVKKKEMNQVVRFKPQYSYCASMHTHTCACLDRDEVVDN